MNKNIVGRFLGRFLFLILILTSCDEELGDNPLDPESENYQEPTTTILSGPSNNSLVLIDTVTFTYSGNEFVTEYSHRLMFESSDSFWEIDTTWSDWTTDTIATYNRLDEGEHVFYVKGRYPSNDVLDLEVDEDPTPEESAFRVNAVSPSSIRVFPQATNTVRSSEFSIDIYAEELENITEIEVQLEYDNQYIVLKDSISSGELLNSFSGGVPFYIDEELSVNTMKVSIGVTDSLGFNGTGSLFRTSFTTNNLTGTSEINLTTYFVRTTIINSVVVMDTISVVDTVHGYINITE